jgi:hypothetical protein
MLLFHCAFCEYAFDNTYNFLLRDNPYYGENTFGQVARLMPERVYVLHQRLQQLKDGGWMNVSRTKKAYKTDEQGNYWDETQQIKFFGDFLEALNHVPQLYSNSFTRWLINYLTYLNRI